MNKDKMKGIGLPQRRFGFIAIEKGFIKADQLYEALLRQRAQETEGADRRPLGMILKDLGHLSVSQIEEVLQTLEEEAKSIRTPRRSSRSNRSSDQ
ncbi:MAG: hypothetical protein ACM34H_00675 [Deltaproteobacteria bacterium]